METKAKLADEQATEDAGERVRPLPDSIPLPKGYVYALNALANDEARFNEELRKLAEQASQVQGFIRQTQAARFEVIGEIAGLSNVPVEAVAAQYQFDFNGNQLVKPPVQE